MKRTFIKDARIINEGKNFIGSVVIEGETIAEILKEGQAPSRPCHETIDARASLCLLPGIIDDHVHFREPGLTHKADMASESKAAAAGGITSFMDMPNVKPQTTTIEALEDKFERAQKESLVNYSFYFGATADNIPMMKHLDRQKVCGIKLFMGSSTGNMLLDNMNALETLFEESPLLIAAHCEDQSIIEKNTAKAKERYGNDLDVSLHPVIRDEEACYASSALAVRLAQKHHARLHILHISTGKELELLEDKPLEEKRITAEACVSHLLFSREDYATLGTRIKCNPAIKAASDRAALRNALKTNKIDVIGTDHAPHLLAEKEGNALTAASGMPMIQFSLVAMMELVKENVLPIEQMVEKMCHAPARLFNIEKRGFIRKGYQADLVLVDPNKTWTLTKDLILSKCGWSPLEGRTFHAQVTKTFVNGNIVFDNGELNSNNKGQALKFNRPA